MGDPLDEGDTFSLVGGGKCGHLYGTSMAAPHVAAVAALVWSAVRNSRPPEVIAIIQVSVVDIEQKNAGHTPCLAGLFASGRVDAKAAVDCARGA